MDITLLIYLVSVTGAVLHVLGAFAIVSGVGLVVCGIITMAMTDIHDFKKAKENIIKPLIACVSIFLFSLFFYVLIPDGKTIAAMALVPKIVENEQVQNMSQDGLDILQGLTRQWAEELAPPSSKKVVGE